MLHYIRKTNKRIPLYGVRSFISTLLFLLTAISVHADTLDHSVFLKDIQHSSDVIYRSCLAKYDAFLQNHPDSIRVHIEKCKFIQFAQYNEEEGYNPNQQAFDSCTQVLIEKFRYNPACLLFQLSYLWGDEVLRAFDDAEYSIENIPEAWRDDQLGEFYMAKALHYYSESDPSQALTFAEKAIAHNAVHKQTLDYARILVETQQHPEALSVLHSIQDTARTTWELHQKAELLLQLEDYASALAVFNRIHEIDSTFNDNSTIAGTLEQVGEYDAARQYLVADTSKTWGKELAVQKLLQHDLRYQSGAQCLATYEALRDFGYAQDPLAIYRISLFLAHPLLPWKARDIAGLMTMQALLVVMCLIPFIWLLPVYFMGHHWNLKSRPKVMSLHWGLKAFWFVSAGLLFASFVSVMTDPGYFYSLLSPSFETPELSQRAEGYMALAFIGIFSAFGLATLYGRPRRILTGDQWSTGKTTGQALLQFGVFKLLMAVYVWIIILGFKVSPEDLNACISQLMASRKEIEALVLVTGPVIGFLLIGLFVPIYEEIVFRGVILDAVHRYLPFSAANVIQSLIFAAIHLNLLMFPVFFLFGILTGLLRRKSGGLLAGIIFHVVNNLLALSVLLLRD